MRESGKSIVQACPAGSFTLEAAVVVPVTIFIVAAVMYISFLLHDRTIIPAVTQYAALEYDTDNKWKYALEGEQFLRAHMILSGKVAISVQENAKHMQFITTAQFSAPEMLLPGLFPEETDTFRIQVTVSDLNGRQALLPYKTLGDGIKKQLTKGKEP